VVVTGKTLGTAIDKKKKKKVL
jgi:tubulin polyglutamylase TTLL6/13